MKRRALRVVGTAAGLVGAALTPLLLPWLAAWWLYDRCERATSRGATRPTPGD